MTTKMVIPQSKKRRNLVHTTFSVSVEAHDLAETICMYSQPPRIKKKKKKKKSNSKQLIMPSNCIRIIVTKKLTSCSCLLRFLSSHSSKQTMLSKYQTCKFQTQDIIFGKIYHLNYTFFHNFHVIVLFKPNSREEICDQIF